MKLEVGFRNFIRLPIYNARVLRKLFKRYDNLVIFDIGSCESEDSIRYAKFFPSATIHAFEPIPQNFLTAKSNISRYKLQSRIKLHKAALSNTVGISKIFKSSGQPADVTPEGDWDYGNKSSSLLAPKMVKEVTPWLKFEDSLKVKTNTLKNYCKKNNIKSIDLMHMDVQGAELMVLQGAGSFIRHIEAIWLEAEAVELYEKQPLKSELESFLLGAGFEKYIDTVNEYAGDMLFVRPKLMEKLRFKNKLSLVDRYYVKNRSLIRIDPEDSGISIYVPENHRWMFSENTYYEKNVTFWIEKLFDYTKTIRQGSVFYDVGGNSGYYSLLAKESFDKIYTFEPSKKSQKIIKINLRLNTQSNCILQEFGLSDSDSVLEFHTYSSTGNDSLIERKIPKNHELKHTGTTKVSVKKMDSLCNFGIDDPDFIKIDVEGAELFVLRGGVELLKRSSPSLIIEYSEATSKDAGYRREEIVTFLQDMKYTVYGISDNNTTIELQDLSSTSHSIGNILAVKDKGLIEWLKTQ